MDYWRLLGEISRSPELTVRGMTTKELCNAVLEVDCDVYSSPARDLVGLNGPTAQSEYLLHELVWYLSGDMKIDYIAEHGGRFWKKIADERNGIHSNYGALTLFYQGDLGFTPVQFVIGELRRDPNSRRAVILYNKPEFCHSHNKDFVCTQVQQFLFRNGKLNSTVYIRSSDCIRGLSFDIPWWRFLQTVIANTVGMPVGDLTVFLGSVHVYKEHFDLLDDIISKPWSKYNLKTALTFDDVKPVVNAEGVITGPRGLTYDDVKKLIKFVKQ